MSTPSITRLDPDELRRLRARDDRLVPLDVRSPDARVVHPYEIAGTQWLPLADVVQHSDRLPRDAPIVTYCT